MQIKKIIKKIPGVSILVTIIKRRKELEPIRYESRLLKENLIKSGAAAETATERDVLVLSHVIEKGLCHQRFRTRFGADSVRRLVQLLRKIDCNNDRSRFAHRIGIESLLAYREMNVAYGADVDDLVPISFTSTVEHNRSGFYEVSAREYFQSIPPFFEIAKSRHSMRLFDSKSDPVDETTIQKAVELAATAPSACNRQAVSVYALFNDVQIAQFAKIQRGCAGFGDSAPVILIITSDLAMYLTDERRLPYVDGGIFCMNLLYALLDERLGACVLNGSLSSRDESVVIDMIGAPSSQVVIAAIAVCKPKDDAVIRFAESPRRDLSQILHIVK